MVSGVLVKRYRSDTPPLEAHGVLFPTPVPRFGHGQVTVFRNELVPVASYHPSQQNTQTGRLTEAMFQQIFDVARRYLDANSGESTTG